MLLRNRIKLRNKFFSAQNFIFIILSFWLMILNIASANREYTFKIMFSSNSINHWETKNNILEVHDKLTKGINEEYYFEIISQGISEFEVQKDATAKLKNNQIIITIGDGKGIMVEGSFTKQCEPEIKRKSLIMDLFKKPGN